MAPETVGNTYIRSIPAIACHGIYLMFMSVTPGSTIYAIELTRGWHTCGTSKALKPVEWRQLLKRTRFL